MVSYYYTWVIQNFTIFTNIAPMENQTRGEILPSTSIKPYLPQDVVVVGNFWDY